MVTSQLICAARQIAGGVAYTPRTSVVSRLRRAIITSAVK
jgi:hypothetical protein